MDKFEADLRKLIKIGDFKNQAVIFSVAVFVDENGDPDMSYLGLSYLGKTENGEPQLETETTVELHS